jgi:hypothetical protein
LKREREVWSLIGGGGREYAAPVVHGEEMIARLVGEGSGLRIEARYVGRMGDAGESLPQESDPDLPGF